MSPTNPYTHLAYLLVLAVLSHPFGVGAGTTTAGSATAVVSGEPAGAAGAQIPPASTFAEASAGEDSAGQPAGAATGQIPAGNEWDDTSYVVILLKLGLGLGLVVVLAWGLVWVLRRSSLGQQFGGVGSAVRVVERTFLGPKRAVYLVEIGDRILALGVTEANIALLAEWAAGELTIESPAKPVSAFGTQLKSLLGQTGNSDSTSKPAREG